MKGSRDSTFKHELKQMIVEVCDKSVAPEQIDDNEALFGSEGTLQLDSLDGLQISMEIQLRYGRRIEDPKELRRIMVSIDSLADELRPG